VIPFQEYYRFSEVAVLTIALNLAVNLLSRAFGLYQRSVLHNKPKLLLRIVFSTGIGSISVGLVMIALTGVLSLEGFPRTVIFWNALTLFLFFATSRLIAVGLGALPRPDKYSYMI
jgi:FlaA1/EpsC-like NDP-sugar epimerase